MAGPSKKLSIVLKKNVFYFQKSPNWISKTLLLSTNPLRPLQNDSSNPYTIYSTWEVLASIRTLYMVLWKVAPILRLNNMKLKVCFESFEKKCFVKKILLNLALLNSMDLRFCWKRNETLLRFCFILFPKSQKISKIGPSNSNFDLVSIFEPDVFKFDLILEFEID